MAGSAVARQAGMTEAFYQKAAGAVVARLAGIIGRDMVDRFGGGPDAASDCVTPTAIFGGVLEDTIYVALFALQGGVDAAQQISRSVVIERRIAGCRLCMYEWREAQQRDNQS